MTTLRTKLSIFIVFSLSCALLSSGLLTYNFSSELLIQKSEDEIKANAFRTGEAIEGLVTAEIRNTEILAAQKVFLDTLSSRSKLSDEHFFSTSNEHFLNATEALIGAYLGSVRHEKYWLGDKDGFVIASSEENLETGSINVHDRPYFIEAMQGKSAVSGTINSRANGKVIIVTVAPIKDETGEVVGVIGNSVYTSFFSAHLRGIKVNDRGKLYILDSNGMILAHSIDETLIKTQVENSHILQLLKERPINNIVTGNLEIKDQNKSIFLGYSKIPLANWVVIVEDDIDDIKSPLKELSLRFIIVLFIAILVTFVLFAFILSKWVTKPLIRIMDTMSDVGKGNLNARVIIKTKDEFGILGHELNKMLVKIKGLLNVKERATHLQVENEIERERSRQSEKLRNALYKLSSILDVDKVKHLAFHELKEFITYSRLSVWINESETLLLKGIDERYHRLPELKLADIQIYFQQCIGAEKPINKKSSKGNYYILVIPFFIHGKLTGIILIERENLDFELREIELVFNYSSHVNVAVSNAYLYQQMEKMAVTDELTGMYNRRYFYKKAEELISLANKEKKPLSIILFDLDYFKRVNDQYGHFTGDEVLRRLAGIIHDALPPEHVLARLGGEEFVLLLPGINGQGAVQVAESMRSNVSKHVFPTNKGELKVSISLGAIEKNEDNMETMLHRVDEALYMAKEQGRNRVIFRPFIDR